jgi:uncharacterized membrane protein
MPSIIAMFGGLGGPEIIIILIVLAMIGLPIFLIIYFINRAIKKNQSPDNANKLLQLERMKKEGLISNDEYNEKRQKILDEI